MRLKMVNQIQSSGFLSTKRRPKISQNFNFNSAYFRTKPLFGGGPTAEGWAEGCGGDSMWAKVGATAKGKSPPLDIGAPNMGEAPWRYDDPLGSRVPGPAEGGGRP